MRIKSLHRDFLISLALKFPQVRLKQHLAKNSRGGSTYSPKRHRPPLLTDKSCKFSLFKVILGLFSGYISHPPPVLDLGPPFYISWICPWKRNVSKEHLTVAVGVCSRNWIAGCTILQLRTDQKSRDSIIEKKVHLLESWHCTESTVNMVFDILDMFWQHVLQLKVGSKGPVIVCLPTLYQWSGLNTCLQWSANWSICRSPELSVFLRFQKNFDSMTHDQP